MSQIPSRLRIAGAAAFFLVLLVIVALRALHLTVYQAEALKTLAGRQQYKRVSLRPERGPIVDRNGEQLALSVDAASIFLRPRQFQADAGAVKALAGALDMSPATIVRKAQLALPFVWLKRRVSRMEQAAVEEIGIPGVGSEATARRVYPQGALAAPLLGFTDVDGRGLEGIEARFDSELRGVDGAVVVERDARGRQMLTNGIGRPQPRRGARVELTIDSGLQHVAEHELDQAVARFQAEAGIAVAIVPATGEILALAQVPRADPNAPDPSRPDTWRNRAVTDSFEPGSTMKAFVAAAAIEGGIASPGERLFCEDGRYQVGKRAIRDHEPYGWLTFAEVIQHSSNICTAKIGERLGRERLAASFRAFGFGRVTGVDLPGEVAGIFRPVEKWGRIHVVTNSFGQGISVTLLQLVRAYGALANGGRLMRPYAVRRLVAPDGRVISETMPRADGRPIGPATARLVTNLLELVVQDGTGTRAQVQGVRVAGKTGTAQKVDPRTRRYSARERISSFVGFAPADDPRVVIGVAIDTPRTATYGGVVAAPVFRGIAQYVVESQGLSRELPLPVEPAAPEDDVHARTVSLAWSTAGGGVPDVMGLTMRDAVRRLHRAGLRADIRGGWGAVVAQDPPPSSDIGQGAPVLLQFGSGLQ